MEFAEDTMKFIAQHFKWIFKKDIKRYYFRGCGWGSIIEY